MSGIHTIRKSALLGGSAMLLIFATSSGAMAQNCSALATNVGNVSAFGGFTAGASSSIAASIGNVQTAFLTQQGSAFVANPGGAAPDTQGGGVWVRGVGGEVTVKSTTTSNVNVASAVFTPPSQTGTVTCASKEHETFAGVQVGSDVARLNMGDGWNVNIGTTAGYLSSTNKERLTTPGIAGPPRTEFEVPFAGTYLVVTKGGFFADAMARADFYNMNLNNPGADFFNQPFTAHGFSVSTSAGYNWRFENNWFIEPSVGFIWSRTKIDAFNAVGLPPTVFNGNQQFSGTIGINDIDSEIGRASLRVGTSWNTGSMILQPFASASVFHEFASNVNSNFQTCPTCVFGTLTDAAGRIIAVAPASITVQSSTSRIGTYGQFSAGLAGQVLNTGWVGFIRGDYRTGDRLEGWTANAGIRYNFLPEALPPVTKGIVKAPAPPVVTAVNWTGFYVGGFLGADFGNTSITFVDNTITRPRLGGIIGGGEAGYNWQIGRYVIGLEGDIGGTNKHGSRTCGGASGIAGIQPNGAFGFATGAFSPFFFSCQDHIDWVATLAGRLGVTWDRALYYVKAGGAFTRESFTATCIVGPNNGVVFFDGSFSRSCFSPAGLFTNAFGGKDDRFGGVVGFGTEFALTANWSAKAEYDFIAFGRDKIRLTDGTLANVDTTLQEVKVGVNYRFSSGSPY